MPDPRDLTTGSSSLVLGCDSYTSPAELGDTEMIMGQNVVVRGGIVQTRPGSRSLFCLPDGNFQGCTLFTPANGVAHLVFAVNGKVYVSAAPFTSYRRLWNLQFSLTAQYMAWAICLKSTDYDNEGNLIFLDNPYSILVMQDGLTRAAYWDGSASAHINPSPAPDNTDVAVAGYQGTPVGLWMIWSGNRLWVSRGNQIYASDIGNPLKFTEAQYINEGRAFYLTGPCTGMIEVPSGTGEDKGFIAFTKNDGTLFQSYIQNRTDWLATPLFQNTILPNVGCVAPRSLITQYGLNWWFSARGLTNLNAAFRQNLSSRIDYQDNQMMASKAYLSPNLSGVCGSFFENYLFMSVPSADVLNRHTWVLDQAPMEGNVNAWTGFWTGWRPIEWCRGIVNGDERVFFGSIDYDGKNRIWEGMLAEKKDNGCAITCYAQLRDHAFGTLDLKKYDWSKFFLSQILGDVYLNVYVASTKGAYQLQKEYKIVATEGQIYMDQQYSESGTLMIGNRVQSRTIRTPSGQDDNECNSCGVESKQGNKIDYAFTHLLVWSGIMGVRAYQIHAHEEPDRNEGDCEEPETGPRVLNAQGCSGLELFVDGEVFPTYTGVAEGTARLNNGTLAYIRQERVSAVSQADADAKAQCAVLQAENKYEGADLTGGVYNLGSARVGEGSYMIVEATLTGAVTMDCESESGTYTLCGFSEWLESSPPKKYLTLTSSGGIKQCSFLGSTTCASANPTVSFFPRVGVLQYTADGCTVNSVNQTELRDVLANCSLTPTTPAASYALLQRTITPVTGATKIYDGDSYSETHDDVCRANGGNSIRNSGTILQDLTNEDTEAAAIARASKTPGTSCTAYRELRGAGDFTGAFADVTFTLNAVGLTVGEPYTIRVTVTEEDYGGGNPVVSYRDYPFTATGSTYSVQDTLVPDDGKQLTVSNPVIIV